MMQRDGWHIIEEEPASSVLRKEAGKTRLCKLEIKPPKGYEVLMTAEMARELSGFAGLKSLVLWCKLQRGAINEIISLPGLESLIIMFGIEGCGRLQGFANAKDLREFACDYDMEEADLQAVAKAPALRILRAHSSRPTPVAIEAIMQLAELSALDLEGSSFDDEMARLVARSKQLAELEIGATRLTGKGLLYICQMKQLQRLDIWATGIDIDDLQCLKNLPRLHYLSLGSASHPERFSGQKLVDRLQAIGALRQLWLDGVVLNNRQLEELRQRYEYVLADAPIE